MLLSCWHSGVNNRPNPIWSRAAPWQTKAKPAASSALKSNIYSGDWEHTVDPYSYTASLSKLSLHLELLDSCGLRTPAGHKWHCKHFTPTVQQRITWNFHLFSHFNPVLPFYFYFFISLVDCSVPSPLLFLLWRNTEATIFGMNLNRNPFTHIFTSWLWVAVIKKEESPDLEGPPL